MILTRKKYSASKLKQCLLKSIATKKRRIKLGNATSLFIMVSYFNFMKKLGKLASLNALMDKKRAIGQQHILSAYEVISHDTKVKKKQRTLDEMLRKKTTTS